MKATLSLLLICCSILALVSCSPAINETPEPDFPSEALAVVPELEGRRIPFKALFTTPIHDFQGDLMLLRNEEEVEGAFAKGYFSEESKTLLLTKNFDLYQVLAIAKRTSSSQSAYLGELTELVDEGSLNAVYVSDQVIDPNKGYSEDILVLVTFVMIQKSDFDFSGLESNEGIRINKYGYNKSYPEQGLKYLS